MNKRWLAAYVKMHHEKKVRDYLCSLNIDNFLPLQTEIRQWSDRKKKVERVLIPMMIFVNVNSEEKQTVLRLPSVIRYLVLRGDHQPSVIPETQMQNFKFMVDNSDNQVDFNSNNLQPGEKIRVTKGSLAGLEGEMVYIDGKSKIAIRIKQLGCAVVELNALSVEKI
jgi:transcription antitermination factor NusG